MKTKTEIKNKIIELLEKQVSDSYKSHEEEINILKWVLEVKK